jgi:hypothetical protein
MPRRSAPDLTIVQLIPGKGRPEPPKDLKPAEARAWNDIIDAMPSQWVDTAGQVVLRRVAAQVAAAERLEDRLRKLAANDDDRAWAVRGRRSSEILKRFPASECAAYLRNAGYA